MNSHDPRTAAAEPKFKNAQVGDKVWSLTNGPGEIIGINSDSKFPIMVSFYSADHEDTFTFNGKYKTGDLYPTLFWTERQFIVQPDPEPDRRPQLNVDDKVLVGFDPEDEYTHRHFSHWAGDEIVCFRDGATSWSTKETSNWPYWKLPED